MDLNAFKYLTTVVREGSFSKASRVLMITANTLRKTVENLEYEIGYPILDRTNKGVVLTKKGYDVYQHALLMMEQVEVIRTSLFQQHPNKLTIASFASNVMNEVFLKICSDYRENVEFGFYECGTREAVEKVKNSEVDMAIIMYSENQKKQVQSFTEDAHCEFYDLFQGYLCIRVKENSDLASHEKIYLDELKRRTMVIRDYNCSPFLGLSEEIKRMNVPYANRVITSGKLYYDALNQLDSFSIDTSWNCKMPINHGLKRIRIADHEVVMYCAYVIKNETVLKKELTDLLQELIRAYGKEKK